MVFGQLVSGSEKNEQTRQVADIRGRVLEEECGLKIEAEPEAFCMYALAYEGDTPVATGGITFDGESYRIQEVAVLPEFRRKKYGDFIVRLLIDKAMMSGAQTIEADVLQGAEVLFQEVGFAEAGAWYEKEGRQWQPMQLQAGNIHKCCNCGQ